MSAVYPTLPKLAVRDNIADDDDLTDIDDEVFIRDGRNGGLKLDDDGGVKRPLMAPRRKYKKSCNFQTHRVPYKALFVPLCYGMIALIVILGLITLCIFTVNIFPMPLTILKNWLSHELKDSVNTSQVIPCTSLSSKVLWTRSLPKLTSEAPLRSNDVNLDGIEDIIVGFSTLWDLGLDTIDAPEYICTRYFEKQTPCLGGVLALNGKTGEPIWTHWTAHAIFSVDCSVEITVDNIKDCVISGRGGILQAINGHDGSNIWEIPLQDTPTEQQRILDVYDARFIADIDGDGIADVIASHTTQSWYGVQASNVLIVSGRSGKIIRNINLPDTEQLFIAPQIMAHPDESNIFVLATSSQQGGGGLYIMSQANLFYGDVQLRKLHHNTGKGVLVPPILIDITSDGIEDIVAAMFNSTIIAYNGSTFEPIWNYTVPNSEVISIPIPGYYNDDEIPDFMVKHQIGVDFLTYYYTVATIIDGRNGQPLLEKEIVDSLSGQMSGLSITVDGFGNDWFLHWSADCLNYEGVKEQYQFMKDQSLVSWRTDLCRLRFNSTLATKLLALSQHVGPPGTSLYFSEEWKSVEFNNSIDPRKEADKYLDAHSRLTDTAYGDQPLVSERSPKVHKNYQKDESIFKHKNNNLLAEIGKYDPDTVYENVDEFKTHKKHNPVVGQDEDDNINVDRAWKHDSNKWLGDTSLQSDKEYDGIYRDDDGNNEDSEQNLDYSQAEVREQRSVGGTEDSYPTNISRHEHVTEEISIQLTTLSNWTQHNSRLSNDDINVEKMREMKDINGTVNSTMDETDMTNVSTASTPNLQEELLSTMSNNNSNIEEINAIQNATTKESVEVNSTQFNFEMLENSLDSEESNVTNNQISNGNQDVTSTTDRLTNVAQRRQTYKPNFPNIAAEDANDDASIEKVFKRESLKNQNKNRLNRKQSLILSSIADKDYRIRERRRTKRKSEISSKRSSDVNGIQRQPPTGILLPSIAESKGRNSIDLIFSTFWLPPSEVSLILSQADLECIHKKKSLSENKFPYKTDDDIIAECLSARGVNYRLYQESKDRENVKITFGQMTIYRMKLECVCPEDMLPNQTCRNISSQQSWPQHLGSYGNGYFKPLRKSKESKEENLS